MSLSRRSFLRGVAATGAAAWAAPAVVRSASSLAASASGSAADLSLLRSATDPMAFATGVASFDPTPDGALLWTRAYGATSGSTVNARLVRMDASGLDLADGLFGRSDTIELTGKVNDDLTVTIDTADVLDGGQVLDPGTHYAFQFSDGAAFSAVGRTRTANAADDDRPVALASTSCQSFQDGFHAPWADVAAQDLDLVLFLGDYIYEYETAPASRVKARYMDLSDDPASGTTGHVTEMLTLAEYRQRYRIFRSDPSLRAAHRLHPFVCIWDDHEIANDRWADGAQEHNPDGGDHDDTPDGDWGGREAAALQAYFEYLPTRSRQTGTAVVPTTDGSGDVYRSLVWGSHVDLTLLDLRAYRDEPKGGFNSGFDPRASIGVPEYSRDGRTMLGAEQLAWFKERMRQLEASRSSWKLIGNSAMVSPLNYASLPDVIAQIVADHTRDEEASPVNWHRDGIPVNGDQWDGYQHERRDLLTFLRHGVDGHTGAGEHTLKQAHDVAPGGNAIRDVMFLTGDIHIGWTNEVHVDWGDAPVDDPVAVEIVCPGISSENLNERIGEIATGRPFPEGTTNKAGPAAIALNPHVRYVDFDANGYTLLRVDGERVHTTQRVITLPAGADPTSRPCLHADAPSVDAPGGTWQVRRGVARLLPAEPR